MHDERRALYLRQEIRYVELFMSGPRRRALLLRHRGAHVLGEAMRRLAMRPAEHRVRQHLCEHVPVQVASTREDLRLRTVLALRVLREAAPEDQVRDALRVSGGIGDGHRAGVVAAEERELLEA